MKPRLGAYIFSALLVFLAVSLLHRNLLGKTFLFASGSKEEVVEAESLAVDMTFFMPDSLIQEALRHPKKIQPLLPEQIDGETLWLARVIYSETKYLEEQELVAWVVRNRVETAYRGKKSYQDVALDPYQFSAFNPSSRKQHYYTNLDVDASAPGWQQTMSLAYYVRYAPELLRPFPKTTRHFYSEQSMTGRDRPGWVTGQDPVAPNRSYTVEVQRFRFYAGVI